MSSQKSGHLHIEGINELWYWPDGGTGEGALYRPSALVECNLGFRSLRAGIYHSEARTFTAWIPEGELAIDWAAPAVNFEGKGRLLAQPDPAIAYRPGHYADTKESFAQFQAELIDDLVRNERLRIYFSPVFGLYSNPGESLDDFLATLAEAALHRVEPELKRLRGKFELQLEQIREAQDRKGSRHESPSLDTLISRDLHLFESENRLASMFSVLAGDVFGSGETSARKEEVSEIHSELREDLERVEQEAREALETLYGEYLQVANEYDTFEIGLQPVNIQVTRRAILWVPSA